MSLGQNVYREVVSQLNFHPREWQKIFVLVFASSINYTCSPIFGVEARPTKEAQIRYKQAISNLFSNLLCLFEQIFLKHSSELRCL